MRFAEVITILGLPQSVAAAERCIESAARFGVDVKISPAATPGRMDLDRWPTAGFKGDKYSRFLPALGCFHSHANLWQLCLDSRVPILILEHDAVFVAPLPDLSRVAGACLLGRPSYGKWQQPPDGFGPLVCRERFPGTHAYYVTPDGAGAFLNAAKTEACTPDLFLSRGRFPWLTEFYPWPVEAHDSFSTIQLEAGCKAKHRKVEPLEWTS